MGDNGPKYNKGDLVLYFPLESANIQLVMIEDIKSVVEKERVRLRQDGIFGPSTGPWVETKSYVYTEKGTDRVFKEVDLRPVDIRIDISSLISSSLTEDIKKKY